MKQNKHLPPKPNPSSGYLNKPMLTYEDFNTWYSTHIEPLFENGTEVYGHEDSFNSGWHYGKKQLYADNLRLGSTHTALLINIKPLKQETAEDGEAMTPSTKQVRSWWLDADSALHLNETPIDEYRCIQVIALDGVRPLYEALKRECCCTGESSWTTGEGIKCDACEALEPFRELLGEKK